MFATNTHLVTYRERAEFYEIEHITNVDQEFLFGLITDRTKSILEIPCGSGRNFDWLSQMDCSVVMADIEPNMIAKVSEKTLKIERPDHIIPVLADMRNINLDMKFDLIFVTREGFQLLSGKNDAIKALGNLSRHLDYKGILVVDLAIFDKNIAISNSIPEYYNPSLRDGILIYEWTRTLSSGASLSRSRIQRHTKSYLHIEFRYTLNDTSNHAQYFRTRLKLKRFNFENFMRICDVAGASVHAVYGDYSRKLYTPGDLRMIFLLGG